MHLRVLGVLLFGLTACATTEPQPQGQITAPWLAPLAEPKPISFPAPAGLTPPMTVIVDPNVHGDPKPDAKPNQDKSGSNRSPPAPPLSASRPECIPHIKPHRGGDALHNQCADKVLGNGFVGFDVLVNGKHFDALQSPASVLWEIKTDNFDEYTDALKRIVIGKQVAELQHEREIARVCGFGFRVGVRSLAHQKALQDVDLSLKVVVMNWC